MKTVESKLSKESRAYRIGKNLLYWALLMVAIFSILLSRAVNIYDFEWTPDVPDQIGADAIAAAQLVSILGMISALGSSVLKRNSLPAWATGISLAAIGGVRVVEPIQL